MICMWSVIFHAKSLTQEGTAHNATWSNFYPLEMFWFDCLVLFILPLQSLSLLPGWGGNVRGETLLLSLNLWRTHSCKHHCSPVPQEFGRWKQIVSFQDHHCKKCSGKQFICPYLSWLICLDCTDEDLKKFVFTSFFTFSFCKAPSC